MLDHYCLRSGICKRKLYTKQGWVLFDFQLFYILIRIWRVWLLHSFENKSPQSEEGPRRKRFELKLFSSSPGQWDYILAKFLTSIKFRGRVIWGWVSNIIHLIPKKKWVCYPFLQRTDIWFNWIFLQNCMLETLKLKKKS